jgi:hypothetical protein
LRKTKEEIVKTLCDEISETGIQEKDEDLIEVLSHLLFSVGSSIEKTSVISSEEVLLRYSKEPTLGNALMAQALYMKEAWTRKEENGK